MHMLQEFGAACAPLNQPVPPCRRGPSTSPPGGRLHDHGAHHRTAQFTTLDTARGDLLDVYADVRAPLLHLPNYAVTTFGKRPDRHGTEPGFTAVLAYADGYPVGYTYGNTIEHGDRYWQRTSPTPTEKYTERPAVALKEIGVRQTWRKTGTARRIHDALLATRDEPFVTLMVNPAAGEGKVHVLYRSCRYEDIGQSQPSPASPVLKVMVRDTR